METTQERKALKRRIVEIALEHMGGARLTAASIRWRCGAAKARNSKLQLAFSLAQKATRGGGAAAKRRGGKKPEIEKKERAAGGQERRMERRVRGRGWRRPGVGAADPAGRHVRGRLPAAYPRADCAGPAVRVVQKVRPGAHRAQRLFRPSLYLSSY